MEGGTGDDGETGSIIVESGLEDVITDDRNVGEDGRMLVTAVGVPRNILLLVYYSEGTNFGKLTEG